MMKRTINSTCVWSSTTSRGVVAATSGGSTRALFASSAVSLAQQRKLRVGDIDTSKLKDPAAGFDLLTQEDAHPEITDFGQFLKQKWRERKGMPHPYDELDPDDEPHKPKKAQFPY